MRSASWNLINPGGNFSSGTPGAVGAAAAAAAAAAEPGVGAKVPGAGATPVVPGAVAPGVTGIAERGAPTFGAGGAGRAGIVRPGRACAAAVSAAAAAASGTGGTVACTGFVMPVLRGLRRGMSVTDGEGCALRPAATETRSRRVEKVFTNYFFCAGAGAFPAALGSLPAFRAAGLFGAMLVFGVAEGDGGVLAAAGAGAVLAGAGAAVAARAGALR